MTLQLRRADCGHFIAAEAPPVAESEHPVDISRPVYLCSACLATVRAEYNKRPQVEFKRTPPPGGAETLAQAEPSAAWRLHSGDEGAEMKSPSEPDRSESLRPTYRPRRRRR